MFNNNNEEQFVTLTEQGNFGLGMQYIQNQNEKNNVKKQLNENEQQDIKNKKYYINKN